MGAICFVIQVDSFQGGNIVEIQVKYVAKFSVGVAKK